MLGTVMESATTLDPVPVSERATLEEVTLPQRSITDFFKSPPKPFVNKPATLFGYFKGNACPAVPSQSLVKAKCDGKLPSKKRKRTSVDDLDSSINDFESPVPLKTREGIRKKVKSSDNGKQSQRKATNVNKPKGQELQETSENHSEKENEDILCKKIPEVLATSGQSKNKLSVNKKKSYCEQKPDHEQNSEESSNNLCVNQTGVSEHSVGDQSLSASNVKQVTKIAQRKTKCGEKFEGSAKKIKKANKEQTKLSQGSDGNISVEISYEDFLKSEGVFLSEPDNPDYSEEQTPQLTIPKCRKVLDYFKKKEPQDCTKSDVGKSHLIAKDNDSQIVTTADVHNEPSPLPERNHTLEKEKCDNEDVHTSHILLSDEECDMDILEISSEIIEISPFKFNESKTIHSAVDEVISKVKDSEREVLKTCASAPSVKLNKTENDQLPTPKTAQTTLCFTKKGLGMKKGLNSATEKTVSADNSDKGSETAKTKNTKKGARASKSQIPDTKPSKCGNNTSAKVNTKKQKGKSKVSECDTSELIVEDLDITPRRSSRIKTTPGCSETNVEQRKSVKKSNKVLRGRYRVAQLQSGCENRSPIRIRLRRCSKGSGEDDESTKSEKKKSKKVKLTKAQQLVEKAKKKRKGPSEKQQSENAGGKDADKTKSLTKIVKKKPVKSENTEKLAAIFTKKKGDASVSKIKPALDPEILRQRQEFLKSSLPENLKRRCDASAPQRCLQYPTIPRCSHIQQIPDTFDSEKLNVWNLSKVDLKLRDETSCPGLAVDHLSFNITQSRLLHEPLRIPKTFSQHGDLSEKVVEVLLKEIKRNNPNFPVEQLYKSYKVKKEDSEIKGVPAEELPLTPTDSTTEESAFSQITPAADCQIPGEQVRPRSTRRKSKSTSPTNTSLSLPRKNRLRRSRRSRELAEPELKPSESESSKPTPADKSSQENIGSLSVTAEKSGSKVRDCLWSDKYHPSQSLEVIGNSGSVKKLKSWLQQWKERTDKEARRLKKLLRKQQKKFSNITEQESSSDWWTDDDSDFADTKGGSDWMENEEDLLCNTMLITGAVGIGKTSTVYALAQELGYQVLEVNATSSRTGKKILGKLQEATQSHQVSKQKVGEPSTPGKTPLLAGSQTVSSPIKPAKMPTAFTNLFTKKSKPQIADVKGVITIDDHEKSAKTARTKRKRQEPTKTIEKAPSPKKKVKANVGKFPIPASVINTESNSSSTMAAKGLNLSSTSLILFDEVDVVFEEDKGFWAAIQSFMNITKRPIILTTTDGRFGEKFEGRFEQLNFKKPPYLNIVTCLQLICLVENVRTVFSDVLNLVEFYRGDLRKCMQCLQFWVDSGGGVVQETQPGLLGSPANQQFLLEDELSLCPETSITPTTPRKQRGRGHGSQSSSDGHRAFTGVPNPLRITVYQEDSSVDSFQSSPTKQLPQTLPEVDLMDENAMFPSLDEVSSCSEDLPSVHRLCVESVIGSTSYAHAGITELFTGERNQFAVNVYKLLKDSSVDLKFGNLELLLPLPVSLVDSKCWPVKSCLSTNSKPVDKPENPVLGTDASDWSDAEWVFETKLKVEKKPPVLNELRNQLAESLSKEQRNCLGESIEAMSELYDMESFIDCLGLNQASPAVKNRFGDFPDLDRISVLPGLTDEFRSDKFSDRSAQCFMQEIAAEVTVKSLNKCYEQLESVMQTASEINNSEALMNRLSVPVLKGYHQLRLSEDLPIRSLTLLSRRKAMDDVISALPLHMFSQTRSLSLDYIPVLRSICNAEQIRHISKTKRRFLHYLDGISLPIREFTMNVLGTSIK